MNYIVKYDTQSDPKPLVRFGGYPSFLNRMFLWDFKQFGPLHSSDNGFRKNIGDITISFEDRRLWINIGYKIKPFSVNSYKIIGYKYTEWNKGFEFDDPDMITESDVNKLLIPSL